MAARQTRRAFELRLSAWVSRILCCFGKRVHFLRGRRPVSCSQATRLPWLRASRALTSMPLSIVFTIIY